MSKKKESITVNNDKALADALKAGYGCIDITGDAAAKIRNDLEKYTKKKKANKLFAWSMLGGIVFWPILLAGLAGTIITKDDLNKYDVDVTDHYVRLILKSLIK